MSESDPALLSVTHRYTASAERVYDAFLDPAKAGKFMFATPTGTMVRAEIDPRVGGKFAFVDRRNGEDILHAGEYLELDRPRRIVFKFGVPKYSPDLTRITIDITPATDGGCQATLSHVVSPEWVDRKAKVAEAWSGILAGVEATVR